jgi:hypothetical protein
MHSAVLNHSVDPIAASQPFADWDLSRASVSGGVVDSIAEPRGGRTLTASSTQRPAYASSDANFNNRASSTGDLTDDRLITDAATLADWKFLHDGSGFELMCVMRRGGRAALAPQLHTMHGSLANIGASFLINNAGTMQISIGNGTVTLQVSVAGLIASGQTRVIGARYKETASPKLSLYAAGSEVGSNSTWPSSGSPSSANPTKALAVGNYRDTYNESSAAPWSRILIWNHELAAASRAAVVARLTSLYGAI